MFLFMDHILSYMKDYGIIYTCPEKTASRWENANTIKIRDALGTDYWIRSANIPTLANLVSKEDTESIKPQAPYFSKGTWLLNDNWRGGYGKYHIICKLIDNKDVFDLTDDNVDEITETYGYCKASDHYKRQIVYWNRLIKDKKCKAIRVRDTASCYEKSGANKLQYCYMHSFDVESLIIIDESCIEYVAYEISDEDMNKICENDDNYVDYLLDLIKTFKKNQSS